MSITNKQFQTLKKMFPNGYILVGVMEDEDSFEFSYIIPETASANFVNLKDMVLSAARAAAEGNFGDVENDGPATIDFTTN